MTDFRQPPPMAYQSIRSPAFAPTSRAGPQWPKVSIVTPSFNQGRYVEEMILSVRGQGYPSLEHIVVDGGSTDGSVDVIERYQEHIAFWVSEPDRGQVHAINKGFGLATGEYVSWLNSDDVLLPGGVEAVVECFCENPDVDLVYGDYALLDPQGAVVLSQACVDFDRNVLLYGRGLISQPASFMRRTTWQRLGPLDERYDFCMDLELWTRAALAGARFKAIRQPVAATRLHGGTKTSTQRAKLERQHRMILNQYGLLPFVEVPVLNLVAFRSLVWLYKAKGAMLRAAGRGDFQIGAATRARRRSGTQGQGLGKA